ncbi:MAG: hypothetical protein WDZ51_00115 [Pirellulaceae bacterium]
MTATNADRPSFPELLTRPRQLVIKGIIWKDEIWLREFLRKLRESLPESCGKSLHRGVFFAQKLPAEVVVAGFRSIPRFFVVDLSL